MKETILKNKTKNSKEKRRLNKRRLKLILFAVLLTALSVASVVLLATTKNIIFVFAIIASLLLWGLIFLKIGLKNQLHENVEVSRKNSKELNKEKASQVIKSKKEDILDNYFNNRLNFKLKAKKDLKMSLELQ